MDFWNGTIHAPLKNCGLENQARRFHFPQIPSFMLTHRFEQLCGFRIELGQLHQTIAVSKRNAVAWLQFMVPENGG